MELLVAELAHLLPAARLEDLVNDSQMLIEICNLLPTLWTTVSLSLMNHLDVGVMVGFLVCLIFTMRTLVFKSSRGGGLENLNKLKVTFSTSLDSPVLALLVQSLC